MRKPATKPPAVADGSTRPRPASEEKRNEAKWTPEVWNAGWTGIPNALIEGMGRLGISDSEFVVLVYLMRRWFTRDAPPFPSRETIGNATGKSVRAVQRALDGLTRDGFVEKKARRQRGTGNFTSSEYRFNGLIAALKPIASDLRREGAERQKRNEAGAADARRRKARATT